MIEEHLKSKATFIIAEVGNNHEGDFALAKELVAAAAESGADAIKFQTLKPEYIAAGDQERHARYQKFSLTHENLAELKTLSEKQGLVFFSTPFDHESAEFLNTLQPIFKIASSDNDYFPLIEQVASFEKPLLISTGLANLDLVEEIKNRVNGYWENLEQKPSLCFLHCVSSYPTPVEQANLKAIITLQEKFPDCVIGYSDHTIGVQSALTAIALGARVIEKHFTLDKSYSDFRDHQLSADPREMTTLVREALEIHKSLGSGEKEPQALEVEAYSAFRRSAAASRSLQVGEKITDDSLIWIRPGTGVVWKEREKLLDKVLRVKKGYAELILEDDIEST